MKKLIKIQCGLRCGEDLSECVNKCAVFDNFCRLACVEIGNEIKIHIFFEVLEFGSKYFRVYLGDRISKMYQRMPLRLGSRFHIIKLLNNLF